MSVRIGVHRCSREHRSVRAGPTRLHCYAPGLDVHRRLPDDSATRIMNDAGDCSIVDETAENVLDVGVFWIAKKMAKHRFVPPEFEG